MHKLLKQDTLGSELNERSDILKTLEEKKNIIRSFGIRKIVLLGVRHRDNGTFSRELEFQVDFENMSLDIYMAFKNYLEKIFSSGVDLILKDSLKAKRR